MTIKTVYEENNNPVKVGEQELCEYEEPGSLLNPIKLEEDSNELTVTEEIELEDIALSVIRKDKKQKDNVEDAIDVKKPDAIAKKLEVVHQALATPLRHLASGS